MKDTAEFKDFSMGLNDTVYANVIEDKELSKVENAVIGVGEIRKRTGYKQVAYVGYQQRIFHSISLDGHPSSITHLCHL
ncbi:hypothetical protein ACUOAQ_26910, partial [Escherichia sp. SP-MK]